MARLESCYPKSNLTETELFLQTSFGEDLSLDVEKLLKKYSQRLAVVLAVKGGVTN